MNQEKIGKFISEKRKDKKLTQSELAEKLGVTDKSISNWENGRNMPDLSLFKPICEILDISINDLLSGKEVPKNEYQERLEENIISTINYSNKKVIEKNNIIGIILILFGLLISVTALTIFKSESSWGSIYSIFGGIISLIGVGRFTKKFKVTKRIFLDIIYFILFISILFIIDYISVINIKQATRFAIYKISSLNSIYYDTPFYDVVRCNVGRENEYYKVIKNQNYDKENINEYCK